GERVDLAAYQRDFRGLADNSEAFFELLFHEFLIREELGERPDPADYARSFPALSERLRLQMEVHQALSSDGWDEAGDCGKQPGRASPARLPDVPGYELSGEIGRGGMGVVYRARQNRPNRPVALKMILDGRFASEHELRRFENEAETIGALEHP